MIGKLFTLIGKLLGLALLALVVDVAALAGYFYIKFGEPMQVAVSQRLAPGSRTGNSGRIVFSAGEKSTIGKWLREKADRASSRQP